MIHKYLHVFAVSICLCLANFAEAQLKGYNTGTTTDGSVSSGIVYTDGPDAANANPLGGARGRVTTVASATSISIDNIHGTFANGDKILLICMDGTNTGHHESGIISSMATFGTITTLTLVSTIPGSITNTTYYGSGNTSQVIKVLEWRDFTLSGGEVTCHAWDASDGSGGVLAMTCDRNLIISGGRFNVTGKGYASTGITWGNGGNYGPGDNTYSGGNISYPGCNTNGYICTGAPATHNGVNGTNGDAIPSSSLAPTSGAGAYTTTTGTSIPPSRPASNMTNYVVVMGNAGYYTAGSTGGRGGDGGGHGGHGGKNGASVSGNQGNGNNGQDGGAGGSAGHDGRGGGIIYLKAQDYNLGSAPTPCFFANGQYGQKGGDGGRGGAGGKGGAGETGYCNSTDVYFTGGFGGTGQPGIPGDAGTGGNGGYCGRIWLIKRNSGKVGNSYVNVKGGKGGPGGMGGYTDQSTCSSPYPLVNEEYNVVPCGYTWCSGGGGGGTSTVQLCDCDAAYCRLAAATSGSTNGNGDYEYKIGATLVAKYFTTGKLVGYDNILGINYEYICMTTSSTDCDAIFSKIKSTSSASCSNGNSAVFNLSTGETATYNGSYIELNDANYTRCYNGTCDPNNGVIGSPLHGSDAGAGTSQSDGSTGTYVTDDYYCDDGATWKHDMAVEALYANPYSAILYPNPAANQCWIEWQADVQKTFMISIKDINGRTVVTENYEAKAGVNNKMVNLQGYAKGVYSVEVTNGSDKAVLRLIVE